MPWPAPPAVGFRKKIKKNCGYPIYLSIQSDRSIDDAPMSTHIHRPGRSRHNQHMYMCRDRRMCSFKLLYLLRLARLDLLDLPPHPWDGCDLISLGRVSQLSIIHASDPIIHTNTHKKTTHPPMWPGPWRPQSGWRPRRWWGRPTWGSAAEWSSSRLGFQGWVEGEG